MKAIDRIIALERELEDTRLAAVRVVLGMVDAIANTPEQREELAQGFAWAAAESDPATAQLSWLMAEAIRRNRGARLTLANRIPGAATDQP